MKKQMGLLAAAALLLFLAACGGPQNNDGSSAGSNQEGGVSKDDCNTVYASVVSVNGDNLTVSAGDRVLSLTVDTNILLDWKEGDEVILYYTGEFGENMEVHYIDKWTENSEVQRPENKDKNAQAETGGSVVE